jgi:hypothetical protein
VAPPRYTFEPSGDSAKPSIAPPEYFAANVLPASAVTSRRPVDPPPVRTYTTSALLGSTAATYGSLSFAASSATACSV